MVHELQIAVYDDYDFWATSTSVRKHRYGNIQLHSFAQQVAIVATLAKSQLV